jgi:ubiquinone/menaquinone biosynthesis C-methylase UbiE
MKTIILRRNATPVYGFLSVIHATLPGGEGLSGKRILDCGAGGAVPPLALFHQHGFDCWGIDVAEEPLEKASQFCEEQGIDLNLRQGDMRRLPFDDGSFDYVYEQYSMCHLSKAGTARAVGEMYRVLKSGGLCLLGVISTDTWPKSLFGEEREPGEYWGQEGEHDLVRHSVFTDDEADQLVSAWRMVTKKKQIRYLREAAEELSSEAWMGLHTEAHEFCSPEAWRARYESRADVMQYVHLYYLLRKP